jgi:hypothetical protein
MPLWVGLVLVVLILVLVEVANLGLGRLADRWATSRRKSRGTERQPWSDRTGT